MGRVTGANVGVAAAPEPTVGMSGDRENHWRSFDNSMSAVSFGFVATAILISMFLIMAVFERLLQQRSPDIGGVDGSTRKLKHPSPEITVYPKGVSVLMPGETVPTFLAHPAAPPPTTREKPVLQESMFPRSGSTG